MSAPSGLRRFYWRVELFENAAGFAIRLDQYALRTPEKRKFHTPTKALAELAAQEWAAQGDLLDWRTMPITRLCFSALDQTESQLEAALAEWLAYLGGDAILSRAPAPLELAQQESAAWDPWVEWFQRRFGGRLVPAIGLDPPLVSEPLRQAFLAWARTLDPFVFAAGNAGLSLLGSTILNVAILERALDAVAALEASWIEESAQMQIWGLDREVEIRRAHMRQEAQAIESFLQALKI